jgi:hypothetical protein
MPEYTDHMKLKLLNRVRALENTVASTDVLPNIRIVFVSGSGTRSAEYCFEGGRLVAVTDQRPSNKAGNSFR